MTCYPEKGETEDLGGPIRMRELAYEFPSKGLQDTFYGLG